MNENTLAPFISDFVLSTPAELVKVLLENMEDWRGAPSNLQIAKVLLIVQNPQIKGKLKRLMDYWLESVPELPPEGFHLSLQTALEIQETTKVLSPELIWTGPERFSPMFRRTDQALLELIQGANKHLLIVSFAVYKAQAIVSAIENAILRNVKVNICLEDTDESQGKISYSGLKAFSDSVFKLASFYTWPYENRPHTPDGKFGSLHAKIAVADQELVLISSANLTDYAMDLNIEMGIMLKDKGIGEQISKLFNDLIIHSELRKLSF